MGLTLQSKGSEKEIDVGYISFGILRQKIASFLDEDYGKEYKKVYSAEAMCLWKDDDWKKLNDRLNAIIKSKNLDKDIVDFIYENDTNGKINYKICKKLYDLLKGKDISFGRFAGQEDDFRQLLLDCYSHRANLTWN